MGTCCKSRQNTNIFALYPGNAGKVPRRADLKIAGRFFERENFLGKFEHDLCANSKITGSVDARLSHRDARNLFFCHDGDGALTQEA